MEKTKNFNSLELRIFKLEEEKKFLLNENIKLKEIKNDFKKLKKEQNILFEKINYLEKEKEIYIVENMKLNMENYRVLAEKYECENILKNKMLGK